MPPALVILALAAAVGYYLIGRIPTPVTAPPVTEPLGPPEAERRVGETMLAITGFIEYPTAASFAVGVQVGDEGMSACLVSCGGRVSHVECSSDVCCFDTTDMTRRTGAAAAGATAGITGRRVRAM